MINGQDNASIAAQEQSHYLIPASPEALNSRGVNGKRTEHQNGGGGPYL